MKPVCRCIYGGCKATGACDCDCGHPCRKALGPVGPRLVWTNNRPIKLTDEERERIRRSEGYIAQLSRLNQKMVEVLTTQED